MNGLVEPITAGIVVSLINRYVIGNFELFSCCQGVFYTVEVQTDDGEDVIENSSVNVAINGVHSHVQHITHHH